MVNTRSYFDPSKKLLIFWIIGSFYEGDSLTEKEAESLMADVDKNKDGVISYKEFVKMLTDDDTAFNDNKKSYWIEK